MEDVIQPVVPQTPRVSTTPVETKPYCNKQKTPLVILLVILGLIIIASSVYVGMKIGEKKGFGSVTPNTIINTRPTSIPSVSEVKPTQGTDETANWKIYTNKEFYFELKYPQNWSFTSEGPNTAMVDQQNGQIISGTTRPSYDTIIFSDMNKNKQFSIGIFEPYKYELSPEQYEKGYVYMNGSCDLRWDFTPRKVKTVTLDTLQVLRAEGIAGSTIDQNSSKYDITCYYIKNKKGNLIVLNALPTPSNSNFTLYDQILSTFKFLD